MESPEQIWFLMSRNLSGEASPEEQEELMERLREQPGLMQQYDMLKRVWAAYSPQQEAAPAETARINRILQLSAAEDALQAAPDDAAPVRPLYQRIWKSSYRRVAIAAGLLIGLWAMAHWWADSRRSNTANEIIAKRGSKTRTILPDGSTVWLNAGSSIRYEPGFSGPQREVTLQGEAFFDVVKQPSRPFIVHAGDLNIKVLGTAFNVKSYDEDKSVETTLIRGLVQITRPGDGRQAPIYLHPHQKIVLLRKDIETQPAADKTENKAAAPEKRPHIVAIDSSMKEDERVETSWVYNRLEFRGDRFDELARKLERWYNIDVHFEDDSARALTFNGSLENETVEQAFLALEAAVPFRFKINHNEVYISSIGKSTP
jgi:ferric-dicitrate binding protein FerR (iron transport regulator)